MTTTAAPLTLRDAERLYLDAMRRAGRTASTLYSYQHYLDMFVDFVEQRVGGSRRALIRRHLTPDLVGQAQDALRSRSSGSRDGAAAEKALVLRVKIWATWLWRGDYLPTDPLARVKQPTLPAVYQRPFSETEARTLLANVAAGPNPIMERALLLLAFDTGGRIGEMCGIDLSDLDMDAGPVEFRHTKNGRPRRVFFGVPNMPGGGPCSAALRAWLHERPDLSTPGGQGEQAVFLNRHNGRLTVAQARAIFIALGRATGVAGVFPHRARHTAAAEFLSELPGAEMHLRRRMGHLSNGALA